MKGASQPLHRLRTASTLGPASPAENAQYDHGDRPVTTLLYGRSSTDGRGEKIHAFGTN